MYGSFPLKLDNKNHKKKKKISCPENEREKMTRVLGTGGGRWLSGEGVQNAKSGLIERFRDREQDLLNLEGDGVSFNKQDLRRRRWWRIRFEAINF